MKTIQIKTLELLLIKALNSKNFSKDKIYSSFRYMLNHFSDDDYLYAFNHRRIISVIYLENFYAHKTVKALTQYLHIDNKTLLSYRKAYLKLTFISASKRRIPPSGRVKDSAPTTIATSSGIT